MGITEMAIITLSIIVGIQALCIYLFNKKLKKVDIMLQDLQIDAQAYERLKAQMSAEYKKKNPNKVGSWKK